MSIESDDIIDFLKGVDAIIITLYERGPLFIVSSLCSDFSSLLATKCGSTETFQNIEYRFCAGVSNSSSHATSIALHDIILALMLLYNANIPANQRVVALFAAAFAISHESESKTNEDFNNFVTYESVVSMIRQLDQGSLRATRGDVGQHTTLASNALASRQERSCSEGRAE